MNTIITPRRFIKCAVNGKVQTVGQAYDFFLDLLIVKIIKNWLSTVKFIQQVI